MRERSRLSLPDFHHFHRFPTHDGPFMIYYVCYSHWEC